MAAQNNDAEELIRLAQAGDRGAFEALLQEYYDVMFRMAFKWCGHKADAEDITQNACIKLARTIDSFRFKSAFTSWLYRLVINTAIDWQRSNKRHKTNDLAEEAGYVGVKAEAEDKLYAQQVFERVLLLPKKEKTALLLVMSEGLTHKEAAEAMECKESTVSWYIHEARKKLEKFQEKERHHG